MQATTIKDTKRSVKALITKVKALIANTKGDLQYCWKLFMIECENWLYMKDVKVTELNDANCLIGRGRFASKVSNKAQFNQWVEYDYRIKVVKVVTLPSAKFKNFASELMDSVPFFEGNNLGTTCLANLNAMFPNYGDFDTMDWFAFEKLWAVNPSIKKAWVDTCCEQCVMIVNADTTGEAIISSPQGYNYSRYSSFDFELTSVGVLN